MKPLSLTYVKYFCDAVRLGSVSASAKANFVTLSAVSQGISNLERSVGASLITHHKNQFKLTPEGQMIFNKGLELLKNAEEFQGCLTDEISPLEFASIYSFGLSVIPHYLKRFAEENPKIKVNFHLANNTHIKEMLKAGVVDFGIVGNDLDLSNYTAKQIYKGHFKLFVRRDVSIPQQRKMRFILGKYDTKETESLRSAYMKKFRRELPDEFVVTSWEAMANLIMEGIGIGFLPDYIGNRKELFMKEAHLDLKLAKHPCDVSAIAPKRTSLRQSSQIFLSYFT